MQGIFLAEPAVGYAYVLPQELGEIYSPEKALLRGTVFPVLDISMEKYGKQYVKEA